MYPRKLRIDVQWDMTPTGVDNGRISRPDASPHMYTIHIT